MLAYRHHPHSHHHYPLSQYPHQLPSPHYHAGSNNSDQYILSSKSNSSPACFQQSHANYSSTHFESNTEPEVTAPPEPVQDFYYMPTTPLYNPPIRVQQSTPTPGELHSYQQPNPDQAPWGYAEQLRPETRPQNFQSRRQQGSHKRNSSSSSVGSVGPASPHTPITNIYPRIVDTESTSYPSPRLETFDSPHHLGLSYSKSLPNSSQASYQQSYQSPDFCSVNTSAYDALLFAHSQSAMTHGWMAQNNADTGDGGSATQRTSYPDDEYEANFKSESRNIIPKLDRTISDICQDELWNPDIPTATPTSKSRPNQTSMLSPYNKGVFSERLQAANNEHISARSASPAITISRERSPYRPGREYVAEDYLNSNNPPTRIGTASQIRGQQKAQTDARELMEHQQKVGDLGSPKTVSPKQTSLDYQENVDDANMPLFPQTDAESRPGATPNTSNSYQQSATPGAAGECIPESRRNNSAAIPCTSTTDFAVPLPTQSAQNFAFAPPAIPGNIQIPQEYPFISHLQSQDSSRRSISDQTPEFPSRLALTSMESTKSDGGNKSEHSQSGSSHGTPRPANTTADTGTYSCTYRGCSLRFQTPQKLQKHKREFHRQSTPQTNSSLSGRGSPGSSSNNVSSSAASRNSQAGPHRCDRINPSTGKPCNSIFSRPYDLTRHEDTIHNARKQKVRCSLCTEEKTFSRNDALTRHMRVVHPEVDFPGKIKRKGGA